LKSLHRLQGIKWDCKLTVIIDNKIQVESKGELHFTGYGLSGPVSLDISRKVNELMLMNKNPVIMIDFYPNYTNDELNNMVNNLWQDKERAVAFSMLGIMQKKMPEVLLDIIGIDKEKKISQLTNVEKSKIITVLKRLELNPGEPRGFNDAVAAAGGVDVNEIDPGTMESRLVKNLYITGELLDIDGNSGGYNLQFAWSTGALAGLDQ